MALFPDDVPPVHLTIAPASHLGYVRVTAHQRAPVGGWVHDTYDRLTPEEAIDVLEVLVLRAAWGGA